MKALDVFVVVLLLAWCIGSWVNSDRENARLDGIIESNKQVAEETRLLTEAIHENNRILEIIEGAE